MMHYRMIWKNTLCEIRHSLGRFLAILAIVALGVGFFAGLKVTRTAMVDVVQEYLRDMDFYDYRLLCNYGFEQEEVDFLRDMAKTRAVEGALAFDAIYRDEAGGEGVVRIYSLTEQVNGVKVLEGRMPESAHECVVDSRLFGPECVGSKIFLSENNEEETLEHFSYREYTIVGRVQSSLYIQFERGNTSLGTGRIAGFVYLQREGFAEEYYTDIYVKFQEDMPLYSDEYKDFLKEKETLWEDLAARAAGRRFDRVKADAEAEYADALEEFETEKADAEEELAQAKQELDDGAAKIEEAEAKISDAKQEIDEGSRELADARKMLADKERELAEGEQKLADAKTEWDRQNSQVQSGWGQVASAELELEEKEKLLQAQAAELAAGEEGIRQKLALLGVEGIDDIPDELAQTQTQIGMLQQSVADPSTDPAVGALVAEQIAGLQEKVEGLNNAITRYEEVKEGRAALAQARSQIDAGWRQMAALRADLNSAGRELQEARTKIERSERELEDGGAALEDGRREIAKGEKELADAKKQLAEGEQELADAKKEYEDGLAEYEDGLAEYEANIADADAELADAREDIDSMEEPESYVLGRDTNVGYVCFESDSGIVDGIANVFPVFFFLVAALVCITTMNRMVEEQRTQIGVLKALGYGDGVIMMKYMFYSGSAAMIGCVLGFFGGTYAFPKVIWFAYNIMYTVGDIRYVLDWRLGVISLVVSLVCSVGTTWLSCRLELAQVAAQLMRPKAPKAGKRVFLERLPFIWRRLSFLRKVSVRNIFRYKKRMFMMILGISGCTALLVTGFGIHDSIAEVANQQYSEIQIYDVSVTLSDGVDGEMEEKLVRAVGQDAGESMSSGWLKLSESSMDIVTEGIRKNSYVVTIEDGVDVSPFLQLHSLNGEAIRYPGPGEAVVSHKIAGQMGLSVGDTIVLENEDMHTIEAVVTGINENFIYNYVYLSRSTYEDCMGNPPEFKTLYMNAAEGADKHLLSAVLMGMEGVAGVTVNEDALMRFDNMMSSLNLIVVVVIFCAAALAFIVLYNLTNINITERVREIATIKVLGFYKKETASYVFRENTVLTLLGALPGLVLGKWLHSFVMSQIKVDMVAFDVRVLPVSYLYSLLFTFLFAWFVNRLMGGKLEKISMTESLKSVD